MGSDVVVMIVCRLHLCSIETGISLLDTVGRALCSKLAHTILLQIERVGDACTHGRYIANGGVACCLLQVFSLVSLVNMGDNCLDAEAMLCKYFRCLQHNNGSLYATVDA